MTAAPGAGTPGMSSASHPSDRRSPLVRLVRTVAASAADGQPNP